MNTKYKLLETDTIKIDNRTLYRIQALKDFNDVKADELGGYIEHESNLSFIENDTSWIYDNSQVYNNSLVASNSVIKNNSVIKKNCYIHNSMIENKIRVINNSEVFNSIIINNSINEIIIDNIRVDNYYIKYNNYKKGLTMNQIIQCHECEKNIHDKNYSYCKYCSNIICYNCAHYIHPFIGYVICKNCYLKYIIEDINQSIK